MIHWLGAGLALLVGAGCAVMEERPGFEVRAFRVVGFCTKAELELTRKQPPEQAEESGRDDPGEE